MMGSRCWNGISLGLLLGAAACGGGDTESLGANARGEAPALRGRILTDTLTLGFPQGIVEIEGRLIIADRGAPRPVQVLDTAGHSFASAGREGSGPGEFVNPRDAFGRPGHRGEFWIYDSRLHRLTSYDVAAFGSAKTPRPVREPLTLSPGLIMDTPRWLDDSTLVALNPMLASGDRRFALFGPDGIRRRTLGAPPPGSDRIRPFIRQQAYGGYIAVHPRRAVFALASRYAGRLEMYDRYGALHGRAQVPDPFEPDFSPARDGLNMIRGPDFRFGYIDVAATTDQIFGLFSGRRFRGGPTDMSHHADRVHVFDWEGRFLGDFRLDNQSLRIAVDPNGKHLYALQHDPQPQVTAYDLQSLNLAPVESR